MEPEELVAGTPVPVGGTPELTMGWDASSSWRRRATSPRPSMATWRSTVAYRGRSPRVGP